MSNKTPNSHPLTPLSTTNLPAKNSLVFSTYPDDATLGMGGAILQLEQLASVQIIVIINAQDALFNLDETSLESDAKNIKKTIDAITESGAENIFIPTPLEADVNRRASTWLIWNALQSMSFQGNVFCYEISAQAQNNLLVDISNVWSEKRTLIDQLPADNKKHADTVQAINKARCYGLPDHIQYTEAFYRFKDLSHDLMSYFYAGLEAYQQGFYSKKLPLVSVLVRTINRPDLLKNALASLKKQNYQLLEVNIVNDGGENIQPVVDMFQFERITIKNHSSTMGRSAAANSLLAVATGEYLIFLDDDDTFDSDHIENLVHYVNHNESMLACYSGIRVGEELNDVPVYNSPYDAALLRRANYIPIHALLFSRKLLEFGCQFDDQFEIYEDWDFLLQLAEHTEFFHSNKVTATYNIYGNSGAGQSAKRIDESVWELKIYNKWLRLWNAKQLRQTFQSLSGPNTIKNQVTNFAQKSKADSNEIRQLYEKIAELNAEIETLNNNISERDDQIANLDNSITERNQKIKELNKSIPQRFWFGVQQFFAKS